MPFMSACAGTLQKIISCEPHQAHIFWGKTKSKIEKTEHKIPYTRPLSGSNWEPWCYQVKKEGYDDSEIICPRSSSLLLQPTQSWFNDAQKPLRFAHHHVHPLDRSILCFLIKCLVIQGNSFFTLLGIFFANFNTGIFFLAMG
jgi:hypothetical protein